MKVSDDELSRFIDQNNRDILLGRHHEKQIMLDLRDARAACREAIEAIEKVKCLCFNYWLGKGCERCETQYAILAKLRTVIGEEAKP